MISFLSKRGLRRAAKILSVIETTKKTHFGWESSLTWLSRKEKARQLREHRAWWAFFNTYRLVNTHERILLLKHVASSFSCSSRQSARLKKHFSYELAK